MKKENYTEWDGQFGDLMSYEEFKECVGAGGFIPDDGMGFYAFEKDGVYYEDTSGTDVFDERTKTAECDLVIWYNQ